MIHRASSEEKIVACHPARLRLHQTFTALRYSNYRFWFFGQLVSLFGTWMQITAQGYFVFELTKSPAFLGYVSFAYGAPAWLFMLYGGVVTDRMPGGCCCSSRKQL